MIPITKIEWNERFAAEFRNILQGHYTEEQLAETIEVELSSWNDDWHGWEPEDAALENMSHWEE